MGAGVLTVGTACKFATAAVKVPPDGGKFPADWREFRAKLATVSGFCTGSSPRSGFFIPPDQAFDRVIPPAHDFFHKFHAAGLQPLRAIRVVC
jgi:hypothetical protein